MDRAVSDVLGYILIFSLILSSVALVTVAGYNSLNSVRDAERFDNAEKVFEVFDANVDAHMESQIDGRATELRLADAGIDFGDPVTLNVTVDGAGYNRTTVDPLVYTQSADRKIRYSGGATIRQNRGYSQLIDGAPFRFSNTTVLTLVETRGRTNGISGSGRVLVRSEYVSQSIHGYTDPGEYTVTVNVTTSKTTAWKNWLEAETGADCEVAGDTVSCTVQTETLYVRTVTIDLFLVG